VGRARNLTAIILATLGPANLASSLPSPKEHTVIPAVSVTTIAKLSGLDEETLNVAQVKAAQRGRLIEHLNRFVQRERPKLFTYRALWAEMVERRENLRASAAENTFDPCEFVTDEALGKAEAVVRDAKERFEDHCRNASDRIATFLEPGQQTLVMNARSNGNIPGPYRWLELDEALKGKIRRLLMIHKARVELVRKYPQLESKISQEQLESQIEKILTPQQLVNLEVLRRRVQTAGPTTGPGESKK